MKLSKRNKVALDNLVNLKNRKSIAHKAAMDAFPRIIKGLIKLQQNKKLAVTDEELINSALIQAKNVGVLADQFYSNRRNGMTKKVKKTYDENEEEIIDELPEEEIIDEDLVEEEDEDLTEEGDEDLVGEEDEELVEEDEDLVEEKDEDIKEEQDEDEESSCDEDVEEEDEDNEESCDEDEESSCNDAEIIETDPLWTRLKRVFTGSKSDAMGNVVEDKAIQRAVMDELSTLITKRIEARDSLAKKVMPLIGKFKYKNMTANQVAKYACDKLDIRVSTKNARAALKGYLAAKKHAPAKTLYTLDSAIRTYCEDAAIEEYLKGDK